MAKYSNSSGSAAATPIPGGPVCPQTALPIPNGGFESGSLGRWYPGVSVAWPGSSVALVSPGASGNYAVQLSTQHEVYITRNKIPLGPSAQYEFSIAYKTLDTTDGCNLYVSAGNGKRHTAMTVLDLKVGDWMSSSFYWTAPDVEDFTLHVILLCGLENNPTASVLVDSFTATNIPLQRRIQSQLSHSDRT